MQVLRLTDGFTQVATLVRETKTVKIVQVGKIELRFNYRPSTDNWVQSGDEWSVLQF